MNTQKINIVDENNILIGVKARSEMNSVVDRYQCTGLFLKNGVGEILIAQRSLKKDKDPGLWGPAVAGTVDEGETFITNIYKEAAEEIGLIGVQFTLGPLFKSDEPRRNFGQWFFVRVDKPLSAYTKQDAEVHRLSFVSPEILQADVVAHPAKYVLSFAQHLDELIELSK